jgi:hypothetical protein
MNVEHVQPEEKVLAQVTVSDGLVGVLVRGGNHADVDGSFDFAAKAANFAVFEHAKQLSLRWRWHFADFV